MKLQILTGKTEAQAEADAAELVELRREVKVLQGIEAKATDLARSLSEAASRAEQGKPPTTGVVASWRLVIMRAVGRSHYP